jgi:hypothetical protein
MEWSLVPTSSAFPIPHTLSKANLLTHGCQSNSWASLTSSSSTAKVILSRYANLSFYLSAFIAGGNICLSNMLLRQRYLIDINLKMRLFVLCKTHSIGGPARPTYCMQPYILHGKKFVWDVRKILNRSYLDPMHLVRYEVSARKFGKLEWAGLAMFPHSCQTVDWLIKHTICMLSGAHHYSIIYAPHHYPLTEPI